MRSIRATQRRWGVLQQEDDELFHHRHTDTGKKGRHISTTIPIWQYSARLGAKETRLKIGKKIISPPLLQHGQDEGFYGPGIRVVIGLFTPHALEQAVWVKPSPPTTKSERVFVDLPDLERVLTRRNQLRLFRTPRHHRRPAGHGAVCGAVKALPGIDLESLYRGSGHEILRKTPPLRWLRFAIIVVTLLVGDDLVSCQFILALI